MCDVTNSLTWTALVVSIISAVFAGCTWWISREKLRLDLYRRRFDVYLKTLDYWQELSVWNPTQKEIELTNLSDSPELRIYQKNFIKAHREAQFLFDDESGILNLLETMHADSIAVIGYRRDLAPKSQPGPELVQSYEESEEKRKRMDEAIPRLEKKLARYLDFHTLETF